MGNALRVPVAQEEAGQIDRLDLGGLELRAFDAELILDVEDRGDERAGGSECFTDLLSERIAVTGGLLE